MYGDKLHSHLILTFHSLQSVKLFDIMKRPTVPQFKILFHFIANRMNFVLWSVHWYCKSQLIIIVARRVHANNIKIISGHSKSNVDTRTTIYYLTITITKTYQKSEQPTNTNVEFANNKIFHLVCIIDSHNWHHNFALTILCLSLKSLAHTYTNRNTKIGVKGLCIYFVVFWSHYLLSYHLVQIVIHIHTYIK